MKVLDPAKKKVPSKYCIFFLFFLKNIYLFLREREREREREMHTQAGEGQREGEAEDPKWALS